MIPKEAVDWHSRWSSNLASFPHEFVIDLGAAKTAQGLSYRHRDGLSRAVRHIEVAYSMDGLTFTSAGNFEVPNLNGPQYLDFIGPVSFRFLKIKAMDAWDGESFASIAEIGLY
ncbi:discoidin domain-containing protein [Sphingobacterium thalpophilum]|uniref:discoidin domain-containing protein n=1 Tax=Sphingobacterium thalpophilum TaxID=259 RepID=UPI003C7307D7